MKRAFYNLDSSLPSEAWAGFDREKKQLLRSAEMEKKTDALMNHRWRTLFGLNSEATPVTKNVRVFIRHQFIPKFAQEKDRFLLTIEGHILDNTYRHIVSFSTLFKRITVQVDRRGGFMEEFSWPMVQVQQGAAGGGTVAAGIDGSDNAASFTSNAGARVQAFRAEISHSDNNKPITARITFERAVNELNAASTRYEVSNALLSVFPNILLGQNKSVSEEEVLFNMWYYVHTNGLLDSSSSGSKRFVRCDAALCRLFGLEYAGGAGGAVTTPAAAVAGSSSTILLNSIRNRLVEAQLIVPITATTATVAVMHIPPPTPYGVTNVAAAAAATPWANNTAAAVSGGVAVAVAMTGVGVSGTPGAGAASGGWPQGISSIPIGGGAGMGQQHQQTAVVTPAVGSAGAFASGANSTPASTPVVVPTAPAAVMLPGGGTGGYRFVVDYQLTSQFSTVVDVTKDSCCTPQTFTRFGGKCFDLEVCLPSSVLDIHAMETIAALNHVTTAVAKEVDTALTATYNRCYYICKSIHSICNELQALEREEEEQALRHVVGSDLLFAGSKSGGIDSSSRMRSSNGAEIRNSLDMQRMLSANAGIGGCTAADDLMVEWLTMAADPTKLMTNVAKCSSSAGALIAPFLPQPPPGKTSNLHSLIKFVDIGDDAQFYALFRSKMATAAAAKTRNTGNATAPVSLASAVASDTTHKSLQSSSSSSSPSPSAMSMSMNATATTGVASMAVVVKAEAAGQLQRK